MVLETDVSSAAVGTKAKGWEAYGRSQYYQMNAGVRWGSDLFPSVSLVISCQNGDEKITPLASWCVTIPTLVSHTQHTSTQTT
jgi:hypothetical protein